MSGSKQDRFTCGGKINIYENVGTCTQEQIPRAGGKVSQSTTELMWRMNADEPPATGAWRNDWDAKSERF